MHTWQKLIFISGLIVGGQLYAATTATPTTNNIPQLNDDTIAIQRQQYQQFMQFLSGEVSDNSVKIATQFLPNLQQYPLYPYAWYRTLIKQSTISLPQLQQFLADNNNFPLNQSLIEQFYQKAFQQQDWTAITAASAKMPAQNTTQKCIQLSAQQKLANPQTLTQIWQDTTSLWLSGDNLPKQCDLLLQAWQQADQLKPTLIEQRMTLAMHAKNRNLLVYLKNLTKNKQLAQQAQAWINLLEQPQNFASMSENWTVNPQNKQIFLENLPRYFKTIAEQSLDFTLLQQQLTAWQQKWQFSESELKLIKRSVLQRFFDNSQNEWIAWRDQQLPLLQDDQLIERRLRTAIRQQQPLTEWLKLLSPTTANKDEWRYWQAWILQQTAKGKKQAQNILQQLSQQRGFYALLAAETLGITYQPPMQDLVTPILFDSLWKNSKINQALLRIIELRQFNYLDDAYTEWQFLLQQTSNQQTLLLAEYALQHHWYDLTVAATIKAKAWDYLRLRLPLAYAEWFKINLFDKDISSSFAMAIARQESAWRPNVRSSANAIGLMQLLPSTAKATAKQAQYSLSQANKLTDPLTNILLGTAHLQQLAEKYQNNRLLIAAAYNAGANRVDQWLAKSNGKLSMAEFVASIPFYETRNYVQNVLSYDYYYKILHQQTVKKFSKSETDRLY